MVTAKLLVEGIVRVVKLSGFNSAVPGLDKGLWSIQTLNKPFTI